MRKGPFLAAALKAGVVQRDTARMSPLEAAWGYVNYNPQATARFLKRENTYLFVWPAGQEKYIEHRGRGDIPNGGWFKPEDPAAFEAFCAQHNVEIIPSKEN